MSVHEQPRSAASTSWPDAPPPPPPPPSAYAPPQAYGPPPMVGPAYGPPHAFAPPQAYAPPHAYAPPSMGAPALAPPTGRLSADEARAARLAVPYLGPDPTRSHAAARIAIGVLAVSILVRLLQAVAYWRRAGLAHQLADQQARAFDGQASASFGTLGLQEAVESNRQLVNTVGTASLALLVLSLLVIIWWRSLRRPAAVLQSLGETHVESPLRWVNAGVHRVVPLALVAVAFGAGLLGNGGPSRPFLPSDFERLADAHRWAAAAGILWSAVWGYQILLIVLSGRAHAERMAVSGPARCGAVAVPAFLPVPNADHDPGLGEAEGVGWILRTAGLFMAGLIAALVLIGAVAEHTLASVAFGVPAAAVLALVGWAMVRRRRAKVARRAAASAVPGPMASASGAF